MFHGKEGPFPYRGSPSPHLPSGRPIRRRREEKSTVSPFCFAGDRGSATARGSDIGSGVRRGRACGSRPGAIQWGRLHPRRCPPAAEDLPPYPATGAIRPIQSLYAFRRDGAACGRYGVASAGKGRPPLSRRFFAGGCGTSSPCRQGDKRSYAAGGIGNFGISKDGVLTNAIAFFFSTG